MVRVLFKNFLTGPATRRYPYVVRPAFEASRGVIKIDYPKCIHCGACARRCPASAIQVGRDPKSWRIENFACVTCGLCVKVCPVHCLRMERERPAPTDFADRAGRVEEHVTAAASEARASGSEGAAGVADA
jgi:formate hydrogenlyase subunit 6/NADH:ubiquinone oxidoreductase subunit I